jgi:hypothetical protein
VTYIVESSTDLDDWQEIETNPGMVGDGVSVDALTTGNFRFIRLRISASP